MNDENIHNKQKGEKTVVTLSHILTEITDKYNKDYDVQKVPDEYKYFYSLRPPPISVKKYIWRLKEYAECSELCFLCASIYIDRMMVRNPGIILNSYSFHRLFLTALVVAIKYLDDEVMTMTGYANIGGTTREELTYLEKIFVKSIKYELYIDADTFDKYFRCIDGASVAENQ